MALDDTETYYEMVIVGGGALVLIDKLSRATQDIDAIMYPKELYPFLEKYDINNHVLAYMTNFALDYYDRLRNVFMYNYRDYKEEALK